MRLGGRGGGGKEGGWRLSEGEGEGREGIWV